MWKKICVYVVLQLMVQTYFLKAQIWQRDPSFSTTAMPNNVVYSSILRSDGTIILAGSFNMYGTATTNKVLRIESDGQLDTSFSMGNGPNSHIYASCLQPDGCLLIAGQFTMIDTISASHIARLNPYGSLDTSFHVGVGPNSNILSMAYQTDGKILIAGTFTQVNGVSRNRIARLMHDGSLDTSFHVGSGANQSLWTVVLQPDGKMLIGGGLSSYNGVSRNRIARLNSDGSIDASFDPGSGAMSAVPSNAK
ncbi:MAG TPA: delta-60 repeat domain-containing protein, partial [Chitinophagaceae bacterium]|nr:delta-60 repeat domain-containing protein [Chitinophagaceae bacterium]